MEEYLLKTYGRLNYEITSLNNCSYEYQQKIIKLLGKYSYGNHFYEYKNKNFYINNIKLFELFVKICFYDFKRIMLHFGYNYLQIGKTHCFTLD